jgi:hypothetical protein
VGLECWDFLRSYTPDTRVGFQYTIANEIHLDGGGHPPALAIPGGADRVAAYDEYHRLEVTLRYGLAQRESKTKRLMGLAADVNFYALEDMIDTRETSSRFRRNVGTTLAFKFARHVAGFE